MGCGAEEIFQFGRKCTKCGRDMGDHIFRATGDPECPPAKACTATLSRPFSATVDARMQRDPEFRKYVDGSMLDKVAIAIAKALASGGDAYDAADAAMDALREPTQDMVVAGVRHEHMGDMEGRWKAMIDVASQKSTR